ncbi:MAG TPA: hypothetical protein VF595_01480 [Tepidisphaeraceae bacterium]|jgi:hypothetical protein
MNLRPLCLVLVLAAATNVARAQDTNLITEPNVINGTINIDFGTRTNLDTSGDLKKDSPALGAKDTYKVNLSVAKRHEYTGEVTRQPKLYSSILGRTKQDGRLYYNLNISVLNPANLSQKKPVGKWVGEVPLDTASGAYDLSGGRANDSQLRVAIDTAGTMQAFTDPFGGKLIGKAEKKENLGAKLYTRVIGGKEVKIEVKKADPMSFQGVELAKGPVSLYPRTIVNGRLDFDYETSNYLTDGITFSYNVDGKEINDKVTGSIKWVEDAGYKTNGKGYYDFNLRFNEDKNKPAQGEAAAFAGQSDEAAFFSVDEALPCLTGTIEYIDTFVPGTENVSASKVTYKLNSNKLTRQQIVNFFKLWMIAIGPTNDD